MCTISWLVPPAVTAESDAFEILFNRDESRERQVAFPPQVLEEQGVRYIAPIDPDAGGSWLAVNEYGVAAAVLNYYQAHQPPSAGAFTSRGKLVTSLMRTQSAGEAVAQVEAEDLDQFRAFILLVFGVDAKPTCLLWEGTRLIGNELEAPMRPITTSSYKTNEVVACRNSAFADLVNLDNPNVDELLRFHQHHEENEAYSVCMSRPDARTVSFSRVRVTSEEVCFRYYEGGPDPRDKAEVVCLPLVSGTAR